MRPRGIEERIRGGIYGVAIGDALGATLEYLDRNEIGRKYGQLRDIVGGGWLSLKPGSWTDDTEMTLAVAEGIAESPDDPVPRIGAAFIRWKSTNPPDIGPTIRAAFHAWEQGGLSHREWHLAAERAHEMLGGRSAGNGALMRTLPVSLAYADPRTVFRRAVEIARMTHWDPIAGLSCALYCLFARELLEGTREKGMGIGLGLGAAFQRAKDLMSSLEGFREFEPAWRSVPEIRLPISVSALNPTGYAVNSLICALWALTEHKSFEDAVVAAVNLGGDADTIGAITGGLAGVHWGYGSIPTRWIGKLTADQRARLDSAVQGILRVREGST
ncbi:MAG: ADP-ribosylglycohydrolase family protein [Candidatus Methanosuratincola sp.]|nr:ADP-ribosylglycohydrolase family protein [Candidatus Methanosuratincola sp.]